MAIIDKAMKRVITCVEASTQQLTAIFAFSIWFYALLVFPSLMTLMKFYQKEVVSPSEVHSITTVLRPSTDEALSYCLSLYANRETKYQDLKNLNILICLCQFSFLIQKQIADFIWPTNVAQEQANLGKL